MVVVLHTNRMARGLGKASVAQGIGGMAMKNPPPPLKSLRSTPWLDSVDEVESAVTHRVEVELETTRTGPSLEK